MKKHRSLIVCIGVAACGGSIEPAADDPRQLLGSVAPPMAAQPTGASASSAPPESCELPLVSGPCKANIDQWGFDPEQGRCARFSYGGCEGNANRYTTEAACSDACGGGSPASCLLPPDPGPCKGFARRWAWDQATQRCELFTYGLCEGNANNYATERECLAACRP